MSPNPLNCDSIAKRDSEGSTDPIYGLDARGGAFSEVSGSATVNAPTTGAGRDTHQSRDHKTHSHANPIYITVNPTISPVTSVYTPPQHSAYASSPQSEGEPTRPQTRHAKSRGYIPIDLVVAAEKEKEIREGEEKEAIRIERDREDQDTTIERERENEDRKKRTQRRTLDEERDNRRRAEDKRILREREDEDEVIRVERKREDEDRRVKRRREDEDRRIKRRKEDERRTDRWRQDETQRTDRLREDERRASDRREEDRLISQTRETETRNRKEDRAEWDRRTARDRSEDDRTIERRNAREDDEIANRRRRDDDARAYQRECEDRRRDDRIRENYERRAPLKQKEPHAAKPRNRPSASVSGGKERHLSDSSTTSATSVFSSGRSVTDSIGGSITDESPLDEHDYEDYPEGC